MATFTKDNPNKNRMMTESKKLQQRRVLQLYRDGKDFEEIAEIMTISQVWVRRLYRKAMKEIIAPDVNELRNIEGLRLNQLYEITQRILLASHPFINSGVVVRDVLEDERGLPMYNDDGSPIMYQLQNSKPILEAMDRLLKIADHRAKLFGLYMPVKVAQTDTSGNDKPVVNLYIPDNSRGDSEAES